MPHYDVIVIGTGGAGGGAVFHLARRGAKVLGVDRFSAAHDRGSSHGQTRIIRQAYFEHPDYVPLLRRAYELWDELEALSGKHLFHRIGLVEIGRPDGPILQGILESARRYDLEVESIAQDEFHNRWPMLRMPDGCTGVFEAAAGFLLVEECVRAHLDAAQQAGAELQTGVAVESWRADGDGFRVETDRGSFSADRLIITAGAWAPQLLSDLGVNLEVRRKSLFWCACPDDRYDIGSGCPGFFYELPGGVYYGFPRLDERGVKLAEHSGGRVLDDPLSVDRGIDPQEQTRIEGFARECLPGLSNRRTDHAVCMYTMTPDEHFLLGTHPRHPRLAFAAGLSGHGFKFTTVLGEALADLALEGKTELPISFLDPARFRPL